MTSPKKNKLDALLIAETVKRIEAEAPLDDAQANEHAIAAQAGREERLLERADWLGRRLDLQTTLHAWRDRAGLVWLALALAVFLSGYGIVQTLLAGDRTLNVMLAFIAALGAHFLTLLLWLLAVVSACAWQTSALSRFSLGNLALKLLSTTSGQRHHHARQMLPALVTMLQRARLLPWLSGIVSHAIWAAAFMLALLAMWFAFSFREYRLTWETTILEPEFFVGFVRTAGFLPHLLGFPMPDTARLLDPAAGDHRSLAFWLMGCTFTYGLLPRVLFAILSLLMFRWRSRALALDTSDPYYRKLLARFEEMERPVVVDPEHRVEDREMQEASAGRGTGGAALIGFELPPECDWNAVREAAGAALALNISGAGDQREQALHALRAAQPARILFVCDQAASPDRGTARFLRQAGGHGRDAALLLLPVRDQGEAYVQRWKAWLADSGLDKLEAFASTGDAVAWLGAHHA